MALHRFIETDLNIDDLIKTVIVPDGNTDWVSIVQDRLWNMCIRFRYGVLTRFVDDQIGTNPKAPLLYIPPGFEAWVHRVYLSTSDLPGVGTFKIGSNDSSFDNFNPSFHVNTLASDHSEVAVVYPGTLSTAAAPQPLSCYVDGDDATLNTVFINNVTGGLTNFKATTVGWMQKK